MSVTGEEIRREGRREQALAGCKRDAALLRIGRTRRVLIGVTAGLTAAVAYFVSSIAPGRSLTRSGAAAAPASRSAVARSPSMPPPASPAQLGLQGPAQAPGAAGRSRAGAATAAPSAGGSSTGGSAAGGSSAKGSSAGGSSAGGSSAGGASASGSSPSGSPDGPMQSSVPAPDNPPAATTGGS